MKKIRPIWLVVAAAALAFLVWNINRPRHITIVPGNQSDALALLLPDDAKLDDPRITVWMDAALEQGLHMQTVKASDFLALGPNASHFVGVVLPDKVHLAMSDDLIESVRTYVRGGGHLFQTFDAGTWTPGNFYARGKSRLSDLAGVDYAFYDELKGKMVINDSVLAKPEQARKLEIPPGKFVMNPLPGGSKTHLTLAGYQRDALQYQSFVTRGTYRGETILTSPHGLVAGLKPFGKGNVLFINLPLGYLAGRTDGLMMHSFLRYFAEKNLKLPRLAAVPEGVGGIIMNWHVDSNADRKWVLEKFAALGIYKQGPYSIHPTSGPDVRKFGDKMGVDVRNNVPIQIWMKKMAAQGHQLGSHGGWIHDYFGTNLSQTKTPEFEKYLRLNKEAVEFGSGKPVTEYSAPQGNHPRWVSEWLDERGVVGYYFVGNTGMGTTRNYRDGIRELKSQRVWAFPVTNLGTFGSFEEISSAKTPTAEVERWLRDMTGFCASRNTSRLIYFHPVGTRLYANAVRGWLAQAALESKKKRFRWYTMTGLATFLNTRDKVIWNVSGKGNAQLFEAEHPQTLARQAWIIPSANHGEPKVSEGAATVRRDGDNWIVVAGEGKILRFSCAKK